MREKKEKREKNQVKKEERGRQFSIMEIVDAQNFEGYWDNIDILRFLLGEKAVQAV